MEGKYIISKMMGNKTLPSSDNSEGPSNEGSVNEHGSCGVFTV